MLEVYQDKQPLFCEEIMNSIYHHKISHAYLIETNHYLDSESLILSFIKTLFCEKHYFHQENCGDCNLCHLIDINALSDFRIIEPDGIAIKKEQILEIKEQFKTTSTENRPRIYWVRQADKLNKPSANSLLKFLEEPEGNVIAILETDNRYQVIETIRSRCQIYSLQNQKLKMEFQDIQLLTNIIHTLEERGQASISYLPITLDNDLRDKNFWLSTFQEMIEMYENALRKIQNVDYVDYGELLDYLISKNSYSNFIFKLGILFDMIQNLNYNLNITMMLDLFIIQFAGGETHA